MLRQYVHTPMYVCDTIRLTHSYIYATHVYIRTQTYMLCQYVYTLIHIYYAVGEATSLGEGKL